jgi:hypothetical protein
MSIPIIVVSQDEKIGDISDGSRTTPVHVIKLIDQDSSVIWLDEFPLMPFSTQKTCGSCHNYQKISTGWHFNAGDSSSNSGRPGQPWIYADPYSATQIPLSLREWPGTFKPELIGINNFSFIATFGRHMPGGGPGDNEDSRSLDKYWRWQVSGEFEINCLSCHDAERSHDQSIHALQVMRENFRWTATASSGFASVQGTAKDLPDTYDIYSGSVPDQPQVVPPRVTYQRQRFNAKGEVFFDITRKIPVDRCYFCHSTKPFDSEKSERWTYDEDVHLMAGMLCVDCHRHGLDHQMIRGYEQNKNLDSNNTATSLTCRGCHLGSVTSDNAPLGGRSGAPRPDHAGIPPIHFEKLSCTTCHSGNWPEDEALPIKTSMAHALGLPKTNKSDEALPHIISPIFTERTDGKIAPHNLIWPSYWGVKNGDTVIPLKLEVFLPIARTIIGYIDSLATGNWPQLADSHLVQVLDSIKVIDPISGKPVYVSGGKIYFLDENKILFKQEHQAAAPYFWPVAHDVRPAAQSLGIRGCNDCHSTNSPFYFGKVSIQTPLNMARIEKLSMTKYLDQNVVSAWIFSFSFLFRPWLKYLIILSSLIIIAVLLLYGLRGLAKVISVVSIENQTQNMER